MRKNILPDNIKLKAEIIIPLSKRPSWYNKYPSIEEFAYRLYNKKIKKPQVSIAYSNEHAEELNFWWSFTENNKKITIDMGIFDDGEWGVYAKIGEIEYSDEGNKCWERFLCKEFIIKQLEKELC